ncbi:MAG: ABC transporter permease [Bacillota bacterium]|jgi:ABC-2 type transport system permease protein
MSTRESRRLGKSLAKYLEMPKITVLTIMAYAQDMLARQFFLVIIMFVFVQLWSTTYRWEGAETIGGYTMLQMLWYLAISESMSMSMPRAARDVDSDVKSGAIAYSLTKPYKYPWFLYSRYMGDALIGFFGNLLIAGAVTWVLVGPPPLTPASFALGLVSALFAYTLDFWAQLSIGLSAFWIEDSSPYRLLYSRVSMLLGGMLLPLDIFPAWLRRIAEVLPTSQVYYGPVRAFLGLPLPEYGAVILRQVIWAFVFVGLGGLVYRAGVKRVNVQGG